MSCVHHWTVSSECPKCLRLELDSCKLDLSYAESEAFHAKRELEAELADLRLQLDAEGIKDMRNEILYLKDKAQAEYDRGNRDGYEDHRANTRAH